uniref:Oligosaccharyltransferase complex subunit n=1 Tax=Colobus angolensis palliatus TaxID=336983 RepID=A0A2K5JPU8_COLAP
METLYRVPFLVLECPNLKLRKPPWLHVASAMIVYALVVVSYFLVTGGIIYDVIVEPPSVGSMTDEHGPQRHMLGLSLLLRRGNLPGMVVHACNPRTLRG